MILVLYNIKNQPTAALKYAALSWNIIYRRIANITNPITQIKIRDLMRFSLTFKFDKYVRNTKKATYKIFNILQIGFSKKINVKKSSVRNNHVIQPTNKILIDHLRFVKTWRVNIIAAQIVRTAQ